MHDHLINHGDGSSFSRACFFVAYCVCPFQCLVIVVPTIVDRIPMHPRRSLTTSQYLRQSLTTPQSTPNDRSLRLSLPSLYLSLRSLCLSLRSPKQPRRTSALFICVISVYLSCFQALFISVYLSFFCLCLLSVYLCLSLLLPLSVLCLQAHKPPASRSFSALRHTSTPA